MNEKPFQTKLCSFGGDTYEIRVFKLENGFQVVTYKGEEPAFSHGYFCDYDSDAHYKKLFGKHGWERLVYCAKADISGKKIYRNNAFDKAQ